MTMVLHGPHGSARPPKNSESLPRKNLGGGGGLGPPRIFQGGGGLFWHWKVPTFKKIRAAWAPTEQKRCAESCADHN